jgi:hypothetical protein
LSEPVPIRTGSLAWLPRTGWRPCSRRDQIGDVVVAILFLEEGVVVRSPGGVVATLLVVHGDIGIVLAGLGLIEGDDLRAALLVLVLVVIDDVSDLIDNDSDGDEEG